jgi:quercetin dioxygenase-like cupin family protein
VSTLAASLPPGPYTPWPTPPAAAALLPRVLAAGASCAPGGAGARAPLHALGVAVTPKVAAAQTNDAYALFEVACPPGAGAPAQRGREDAVVFVLEGELALTVGGCEHRAAAGACAFVPRGTAHAYRNAGPRPARALVLCTPGAAREGLYAALDAWGRGGGPGGGPPDVRVLPALFAAFGAELVSDGAR